MTKTEILITHHSRTLHGYFYEPEGRERYPLVIMSHGYNGHKSDFEITAQYFAAAGIASGVLLAVFVFAFIYRQLPPIDTLADYRPRVPLRVLSADGKLIG